VTVGDLPPSDRDPDGVGRIAREILAHPRYDEPPTPLLERFWSWVGERIAALLELLGTAGGGGQVIAWVVLVAAVVVVTLVVVRAVRRWSRTAPARAWAPDGVLELARSPAQWRQDAAQHEAEGRFAEAVLCRYRALVGELVADGAIPQSPGRTAREYVADVRTSRPAGADAFEEATNLFEGVWYGAAPAGAEQSATMADLERAVLHGARQKVTG
jgi:hypothetical protein